MCLSKCPVLLFSPVYSYFMLFLCLKYWFRKDQILAQILTQTSACNYQITVDKTIITKVFASYLPNQLWINKKIYFEL